MSDPIFDEEDDEQEQDDRTVTVKRSDLRALQRTARDGKKAQDKLATYERRDAFEQAGVPLTDKRASYFIKGYDGDVSPEAISAAWEEAFGQAPPESSTDPAEAAAHQRVAAAATGAEPPKTSISLEDLQNANSPEDVMALVDQAGMRFHRE